MTKLYVGNLPYTTTNQELNDMFAQYGRVASAILITDKYSGRSKGFGFVELEEDADAEKAIQALNGSQIGGRTLIVSVARPREERPNRGDFGDNRDRNRGGRRDRR